VHGDVATFDRFARAYDLVMPSADADALTAGIERAERDVDRVLDVGGGSGRGARAISASERIVVDPARGMLRQAHRRGLQVVQGDGARLPIEDGSADAVLIVDAFHHMPDRDDVIGSASRVLAPGGVLVVADFDPSTIRGRGLVAAERLVGFGSQFDTPDRLCERMTDTGLSATIVERGFGYVVTGVAPSERSRAVQR
jgi:demethylmenaquinone methyltransferase/2-methoxy-6-polyprenyl-1,4-benzoquinol methylase